MEYRRDIDGLRAVAVLPVVLFHLKAAWMPGGFVGVDIFFVISGYLITRVLLDDIEQSGGISILRFYERRIRRIFPALFAVLLVSTAAALVLFLPNDLLAYARSLRWTTIFASNVWFSTQGGYFAQPASTRPLLHTWSLAVEEQFYFLYPLYLVFTLRLGRRRFAAAIGLALLGCAALSVWVSASEPARVFYLAPFRAWELLIGAFLAADALRRPSQSSLSSALGLLGLCLVGYSLVAFSSTTPFPIPWAFIPTTGAALVIYAGGDARAITHRLLGWPPVVGLGLVSYSLYLWHWVAIVFVRYYLIRPITDPERLLVFLAALVGAWLSWRYVERPFRGTRGLGTRSAVLCGAAVASLLALCGAIGLSRSGGLPQRFAPDALRLMDAARDTWPDAVRCMNTICDVGAPGPTQSFLLWGDSHAKALGPLFDARARATGRSGALATWNGCPPLVGGARYGPGFEGCQGFNAQVLRQIDIRKFSTVVLHARWALAAEGDRYGDEDGRPATLTPELRVDANARVLESLLDRTVTTLQSKGIRVVIIAGIPEVGVNVPSALARSVTRRPAPIIAPTRAAFDARQGRSLNIIRRIATAHGVEVVYPHESLCDQEWCDVLRDGEPLYLDEHHLSLHGISYIRPMVDALLP